MHQARITYRLDDKAFKSLTMQQLHFAFSVRKQFQTIVEGCGVNALRQVHSPLRSTSKQSGSHTLPTWRPRQLCIQDNRFREYLMKSLQWISIFYQPSQRHAEHNPNNNMTQHVRLQWGLGQEEDTLGQTEERVVIYLFFQSNRLAECLTAPPCLLPLCGITETEN